MVELLFTKAHHEQNSRAASKKEGPSGTGASGLGIALVRLSRSSESAILDSCHEQMAFIPNHNNESELGVFN